MRIDPLSYFNYRLALQVIVELIHELCQEHIRLRVEGRIHGRANLQIQERARFPARDKEKGKRPADPIVEPFLNLSNPQKGVPLGLTRNEYGNDINLMPHAKFKNSRFRQLDLAVIHPIGAVDDGFALLKEAQGITLVGYATHPQENITQKRNLKEYGWQHHHQIQALELSTVHAKAVDEAHVALVADHDKKHTPILRLKGLGVADVVSDRLAKQRVVPKRRPGAEPRGVIVVVVLGNKVDEEENNAEQKVDFGV